MKDCTNCGHELGVGRFCTNCGHPIDWGTTDTAERPTVSSPPPARFPLYADEPEPTTPDRRTGAWVTWLAVAVALTLVAGLGFWLLTRGDGDGDATGAPATSESAGPSEEPTAESSPTTDPVSEPGELASRSEVEVPATDPPGQDVSGNPVSFEGANLLDGAAETCWRMPGDGTGEEIVVTLPAETRLRSVGMINGYAKTAQDPQGRELDWYHGNRRILSAEWVFDDGSTLVQNFDDDPAMQSVDVDVTTTTITIRLLDVSPPGNGPAGRNYTAVSELSFVGR
ncbi:zinc ribbon domain-containing protein [Nocardioides sp. SR21]|uniref:NADase-type glycan-binding domain-containing protein n=1 Tax=Nocardioides sp. SR21 TaxID=2919501 RepID=UPI001FAA4E49|nr:zinc ribbon domain-containing protein [Nocardioides sp. SR21]